jgi:hypothetical protein
MFELGYHGVGNGRVSRAVAYRRCNYRFPMNV